jgi:hypothetical protein
MNWIDNKNIELFAKYKNIFMDLYFFASIKKWLYVFIPIFIFLNCSTYSYHRRKDLQDIATFGIEKPGLGIGLRISVLPLGLFFQGGETSPGKKDKGEGYGLRGGSFGKYYTQQLVFGAFGGETFHFGEPVLSEDGSPILEDSVIQTGSERDNLKSYNLKYLKIFTDPPKERQKRSKEKIKRTIAEQLYEKKPKPELLSYLPKESKKPKGYPGEYKYQFEVFLGMYYGVRIGINFSELVDFLLGFTTLDILGDDVENRSPPEKE